MFLMIGQAILSVKSFMCSLLYSSLTIPLDIDTKYILGRDGPRQKRIQYRNLEYRVKHSYANDIEKTPLQQKNGPYPGLNIAEL